MAFVLRKPPHFDPKLKAYPFQLDAFRAVKALPYAAIFHEQGLGKTKIAIDLLLNWLTEDTVDTTFVVTKKSLVQNWVDEFAIHSFVTPSVLSRDRRNNSIALNSPVLVYILNYEVVSTNLELFKAFLMTCRVGIILDESQKIKNPKSNLASNFHSISHLFERRVIMTGTPAANRPFDIWSQIKFLGHGLALGKSFHDFKNQLDLPSTSLNATDYGVCLAGIFDRMKGFSVRETKKTAGIELPEKSILNYSVDLVPKQQSIYASYRNRLKLEIQTNTGSKIDDAEHILKRLLRLVQCASNPILIDHTYKETPSKFIKLLEILDQIYLYFLIL